MTQTTCSSRTSTAETIPSTPTPRARRDLRAALLLLTFVAGSVPFFPGSAWARDAKSPWRSVTAPADVVALADYIIQPPGGDEGPPEIGGDSLREKEPPPGNPGANTPFIPPGNGPGFSIPDSVKARSSSTNPNYADTLAPGSPGGQFHPAATSAPPPGARHGVLGIPPLALLAGLLALHIFVVTVAGK